MKSYAPTLPVKFIDPIDPNRVNTLINQLRFNKGISRTVILDTNMYPNPKKLMEDKFRFLKVGESNGIFNFIVKDVYYKLQAELIGSQVTFKISCAEAGFEQQK